LSAIKKSIIQVFPSKWALNSAKVDYNAENPFLVKMGANIDEDPDVEELIKQYDSNINILFVGKDWKRKGGDIALETIDYLDNQGYKVDLTVCGCIPPIKHPKMINMLIINISQTIPSIINFINNKLFNTIY